MEAGERIPVPLNAAVGHASATGLEDACLDSDQLGPLPFVQNPSSGINSEPTDVLTERARVESVWANIPLTYVDTLEALPASTSAQPPPAVLLRNLRKVYAPLDGTSPIKVAVDNLSLMVGHRESFGLLGPNGAGKTTTLRMMQGQGDQSD